MFTTIRRGAVTLLASVAAILLVGPAGQAAPAAQQAYGPTYEIGGWARSDVRPTIVRFRDRLFAFYVNKSWPGYPDAITYNFSSDGVTWSPLDTIDADIATTTDSPAVAVYRGRLYLFFKSGYNWNWDLEYMSSADGEDWSTPKIRLPVGGSSEGPSVAVFNNLLHVVWKGLGDDQRIFTITGDGTRWAPGETQIARDGGTSSTPAVAAYDGKLVMVWKGVYDDTRMFWAFSDDGINFTGQRQTFGYTSDGPALGANDGGLLYHVWKGVPGDTRMFMATTYNLNWTERGQVGGDTSDGPALAANNGTEYLAWKGVPGDTRLFYTAGI